MKSINSKNKLETLARVSGVSVLELIQNPVLRLSGGMILDEQNLLSDDQAITVDVVSTNYIDLGAVGRDIGKGVPIPIIVQHVVDAGGTSPTMIAILEVDDNTSFSSAKEVDRSTLLADAVAGDKQSLQYIPEGTDERYLRISYDVSGTTPTHTVTAGIVLGADQPHGF